MSNQALSLPTHRLHLEKLPLIGKNFSYSLAAWLLAFFDQEIVWKETINVGITRPYLESQIASACEQYEQQLLDKQMKQWTFKQTVDNEKDFQENVIRKDKRLAEIIEHQQEKVATQQSLEEGQPIIIKIYTTYEPILQLPFTSHEDPETHRTYQITLTESIEDADFIFITSQIKDFYSYPVHQRVNQVPYESAIVAKDLIPLTVREYSFNGKEGKLPDWWLPCYDLSTEFHLFAKEFQERCKYNEEISLQPLAYEGEIRKYKSNHWFVKPCGGTRALGHRILTHEHGNFNSLEGLHHASVLAPMLSSQQLAILLNEETKYSKLEGRDDEEDYNTMMSRLLRCQYLPYDKRDRVAQLLVEHPLLMKDRKFDMRYYVLVRSFYPFEAYVHQLRYARLANKAYHAEQLYDQEVVMSVTCHHDDEEIANKQERVHWTNMPEELEKQYGIEALDIPNLNRKTEQLLSELFGNAGRCIGQWPNSSAYYAVDIIYDAAEVVYATAASKATGDTPIRITPQPKLVEVSFLGDWHGVEVAVENIDHSLYHQFANDVLLVLATNCSLRNHPRLTRL